MPYLTTRKNLKLQLSSGLVASYDIQPGNGVGLFWDTTHTPDPQGVPDMTYVFGGTLSLTQSVNHCSYYGVDLTDSVSGMFSDFPGDICHLYTACVIYCLHSSMNVYLGNAILRLL